MLQRKKGTYHLDFASETISPFSLSTSDKQNTISLVYNDKETSNLKTLRFEKTDKTVSVPTLQSKDCLCIFHQLTQKYYRKMRLPVDEIK